MKAIHVVGVVGDASSGPACAVPALCTRLASQGMEVQLHANEGENPSDSMYSFRAHGRWSWPARLDYSPRLYRALKKEARTCDVLHCHGLWAMPYLQSGWAARKAGCKLVVSTRGMLRVNAMKESRWKKRLVGHLWQYRILQDAACIHVTSDVEYEEARGMGVKAPICIIPNGVDLPKLDDCPRSNRSLRRLLFLSRIHALKGLDLLIHSWSRLQDQFPDWELWIVGPLEGAYPKKLQSLARRLRTERTTFTGELLGERKATAYGSSDLFALPSHSESFGMVVAEALAHRVPAVVSKGAPWEGLESERCGWWIDVGEAPLTECLRKAMSKSREQLESMGEKGRRWMERDFGWDRVARMMRETYEWMCSDDEPPEWIRVD